MELDNIQKEWKAQQFDSVAKQSWQVHRSTPFHCLRVPPLTSFHCLSLSHALNPLAQVKKLQVAAEEDEAMVATLLKLSSQLLLALNDAE